MNNGCLVVYKPKGITSHDVIDKIRRVYRVKCGHAGTLDPMAQGVLLVFMGKALKLINYIAPEHLDKAYLMKVALGSNTDSYDATGTITETFPGKLDFSSDTLIKTLRKFVGSYEQVPPAFSAIKVGGKRAYAMARAGQEVKLNSRPVHVTSIRLLKDLHSEESRHLLMRVHCSRGTYVRSIAYDIGKELGCGGHLSYLLRERVGKWAYTQAFPYWKIEKGIEFNTSDSFINFSDILPFPRLQIVPGSETRIKNGQSINIRDVKSVDDDMSAALPGSLVQILSDKHQLIALYGPGKNNAATNNELKLFPVRVFPAK